jgi:hypothetical protein
MAWSWRAADQVRDTLQDRDLRWEAEAEAEPEPELLPPLLLRRWCPCPCGRGASRCLQA